MYNNGSYLADNCALMKFPDALKKLNGLEDKGVTVFSRNDLGVVFQEHGDTLSSTVKRLTKYNVLKKIANGLYVNAQSKNTDNLLYKIVQFLRPDDINYLSNESVLCNLSIISQQMLDRITVMTTGRSGIFNTPFGVVEFTHTKRDPLVILKETARPKNFPIRIANKYIAVRDLKRIGRNVNMIDWKEFSETD